MTFDTIEEAQNYSWQEWFWILTWTSSKTRWVSNEVNSRQFVCPLRKVFSERNKKKKHVAVYENEERDVQDKENSSKRGIVKGRCEACMWIMQEW